MSNLLNLPLACVYCNHEFGSRASMCLHSCVNESLTEINAAAIGDENEEVTCFELGNYLKND